MTSSLPPRALVGGEAADALVDALPEDTFAQVCGRGRLVVEARLLVGAGLGVAALWRGNPWGSNWSGGGEPAAEGGDSITSGIAAGLVRAAVGVVVVGTLADGGEGQIGRLRADPVSAEVATVDGIDTAAGRVSTVLALSRALGVRGGAFGASGADGPAPLG